MFVTDDSQRNEPVVTHDDFLADLPIEVGSSDPRQRQAEAFLGEFFETNPERVYFSRQIEVQNENTWFHWITNRALHELVRKGVIRTETRSLVTGGSIHLLWNKRHRYYRRDAKSVVKLVEAYSDPNIGGALGLHGEAMVLEGFARNQFVMRGRETRSYGGRGWEETRHDLDFVFERDGIAYGIEVKNTLRYIDHDELEVKIRLCQAIGVRPVFVARMLPKSWIKEVVDVGGFALILKYQLYPWTHRELAKRVSEELGLPVDAPRALEQGTMERFLHFHRSVR